ncbi:cysteine proteinase [Pisolithus orientalis]|uniref:cysteine proteinase n=1 Tax=Pisolithus orientalis TaxID=936130 RepID=UPI002224C87E|nr:cysteine proteinase [Pisolithus orientalis]KAI5993770.1 cysteine proteinase [Pisolithus orientalis]
MVAVLLQEGNATMVQQAPFLSGYPILPDDMEIKDLPRAQLYAMNQKLLEESIPSEQPLMSEPAPISTLRAEYENGSSSFVAQIDDLVRQGFTSIIRTRGDGDCFYRSLAFAYIEQLIRAEEPELAVVTALSGLESQKEKLMKDAGFQEIVYDLPYGVFTDLIKRIISQSGDLLTSAGLLETFQDSEGTQTPQYIVMYLRLLTSAQIRTAPEEFEGFIMHPDTGMKMTVTEFCLHCVDPMGKEADYVQIAALSRALQVRIQIAYLDGRSSDGKVEFVEFNQGPDSRGQPLLLLYRPGHYDIIDKNGV